MTRTQVALGLTAVLLLAGCTQGPTGTPAPVPTPTRTPTPTPTVDPNTIGPVQPVGGATVIASGLVSPWSMVRLESGSTLISERDTGFIKELLADGTIRDVAAIPDVQPNGEGGLLGIEFVDDDGDSWLYVYFTSASDNRIVRFPLDGDAGTYALGAGQPILTGLANADHHNGGRIKLGPDGKLYATVGDAGSARVAQDPAALNGKILRLELDGSAPADNPFPGSLVYSLGHRNPQGITWDRDGRLWAAEFGQSEWDEFNLIEPGGNYGWPEVEGIGNVAGFINPVLQWATRDASPSGLVWTRDTFFMAALRGQAVWAIYANPDSVHNVPWFVGEYGRIRDVVAGPDGSLWFLTNNTDGRGSPREGDDKIVQYELAALAPG
jgi:glucose/arabinose dehydrogenase